MYTFPLAFRKDTTWPSMIETNSRRRKIGALSIALRARRGCLFISALQARDSTTVLPALSKAWATGNGGVGSMGILQSVCHGARQRVVDQFDRQLERQPAETKRPLLSTAATTDRPHI
ncbi:hypothetical protein Trisim1_012476 [Trichoderma cf. simile WF8]